MQVISHQESEKENVKYPLTVTAVGHICQVDKLSEMEYGQDEICISHGLFLSPHLLLLRVVCFQLASLSRRS